MKGSRSQILSANMEFTQPHLAMSPPMGTLDPLKASRSIGGVAKRQRFDPPFFSSGQLPPSPSYSATSTCLRGFKDGEGYDMICFCTGCQDLFIAQEIQSGSEQNQTSPSDMSILKSGTISDGSERSPSRSTSSPRPSQKRKVSKGAGVSKPATNAKNLRPDILIDQLEVALHGDENSSAEFKWKTSVLFNELKRLIENESTSQKLNAIGTTTAQPALHSRRPKKKEKKDASKGVPYEKIFHCTKPNCKYSTSSSMDWRRHEETHWPQKRYMCVQCPTSDPDFDLTKCSYCLSQLYSTNDSHSHYLQCESARRNARSFARKDKLSEHLQKDHSFLSSSAMSQAATWIYPIDSGWPRQCDFCFILFDDWDERAIHLIENHFRRSADHRVVVASKTISGDFLEICDPMDTKNFDAEFTSTMPQPQDESYDFQHQFSGFNYSSPEKRSYVKEPLSQLLPPDMKGQIQFSYAPSEQSGISTIPEPPAAPEMSLPFIGYTFKRFHNYAAHPISEEQSEPAKPASQREIATTQQESHDPTIEGSSPVGDLTSLRKLLPQQKSNTPEPAADQVQDSKPGMKGFRQRILSSQKRHSDPRIEGISSSQESPALRDQLAEFVDIPMGRHHLHRDVPAVLASSGQPSSLTQGLYEPITKENLSTQLPMAWQQWLMQEEEQIDMENREEYTAKPRRRVRPVPTQVYYDPTISGPSVENRVQDRLFEREQPLQEAEHEDIPKGRYRTYYEAMRYQPTISRQAIYDPTIEDALPWQLPMTLQQFQDEMNIYNGEREDYCARPRSRKRQEYYDPTISLSHDKILRQEREMQARADREQFSVKPRPVSVPIDYLAVGLERAEMMYQPQSYRNLAGTGMTFERSLSKMAPAKVSSGTWFQRFTQRNRGPGQERKYSVPQARQPPEETGLSSAMARMSINKKTLKGAATSPEGKTRWYDRLRGTKQRVEPIVTPIPASPPVLDPPKLPPIPNFDVDEISFLPPIET